MCPLSCPAPAAPLPLNTRACVQVPLGPKVQDNSSGKKSQNRTWTDLLKDEHDSALFEYYGTSQLLLVDVRPDASGRERPPLPLGPPRMYTE